MGFGKAKYGSSGGCPTWTLKPGDNVYRILPPMHSLADQGEWRQYHASHWGYEVTDPRNPGKTRQTIFKCIEVRNWNTKMVEKPCPECELHVVRARALEDLTAQLRAKYKAAGKAEPDIDKLVEAEVAAPTAWLFAHNLDKKFYMAAMSEDRKFGHLKISPTTKRKLEAKLAELRGQGIDPLDLAQGVWLNFKRMTKNGLDDVVEPVTELVDATVNGRQTRVPQIVLAPISDDEADRALEDIRDLTTAGGIDLTYEQVALLTQVGEDPDEADKIFKMERSNGKSHGVEPKANPLMTPENQARLTEILSRKASEAKAAELQRTSNAAVANGLVATAVAAEEEAGGYTGTISDDDFLALVQQKAP